MICWQQFRQTSSSSLLAREPLRIGRHILAHMGCTACALFLCAASLISECRAGADPLDESLLAFAVHIHQTPMQSWGPGAGIYLGRGVFITAAHVAGHTWWTRPKVAINDQEFSTRTIKEGSFEGTDITLLGVDERLLPLRLRLRHLSLCTKSSYPGEEVVTIVPGAAVHSHVMPPQRLPVDVRRFSTVISDVADTGNSGSGVFDVESGCLLGIMSRKISERRRMGAGEPKIRDIAKYFVPATSISDFLPAELRF